MGGRAACDRAVPLSKKALQMNSKMDRMCFYGNLKRIGGPEADPEKYNLYCGLAKLAEAVSDVDRRVQLLRQEVNALRPLNGTHD